MCFCSQALQETNQTVSWGNECVNSTEYGVCLVWQSLAILVFLLAKTAAASLCISWRAYWGLQCVITCVQTLIQNFQWSSIVITSKHFISLHGCWPCWVADVTMLSYLWYLDVNKLHALPYSCISPLCKALLATAACPSTWFLWTCAAVITFHTLTFCLLGRAASGMFRLLRTGWYQLLTLMSLLKVFLVRRCVSFEIILWANYLPSYNMKQLIMVNVFFLVNFPLFL